MKIIKDRDQVIYYFDGQHDLEENEEIFNSLEIGLDHFESTGLRICPRSTEEGEYKCIWHILLPNTGNRKRDLETLKSGLARFKREFIGEL